MIKNYYEEFQLEQDQSVEDIKKQLSKARRTWTQRLNAPNMEKRQKAESTIVDIEQALLVFADADSKARYDQELNGKDTINPVKPLKRVQPKRKEPETVSPQKLTEVENEIEAKLLNLQFGVAEQYATKMIKQGFKSPKIRALSSIARFKGAPTTQNMVAVQECWKENPKMFELNCAMMEIHLRYYSNFEKAKQHLDTLNEIQDLNKRKKLERECVGLSYKLYVNGYSKTIEEDAYKILKEFPNIIGNVHADRVAEVFYEYGMGQYTQPIGSGEPYPSSKEAFEEILQAHTFICKISDADKYREVERNIRSIHGKKSMNYYTLIFVGMMLLVGFTSLYYGALLRGGICLLLVMVYGTAGMEPEWKALENKNEKWSADLPKFMSAMLERTLKCVGLGILYVKSKKK